MPPTASREHPRGGKRFRRGWGGRDPGCGWRPQPHQRHWACMPGGRALGASGKAGSRRCCPECPGRHAEVSYSPRLPMTEALGGARGSRCPSMKGGPHGKETGRPPVTPLVPARGLCSKEGTPRQRRMCPVCVLLPGKRFLQKQYFRFGPCSISAKRLRGSCNLSRAPHLFYSLGNF